MKNKSEVLAHKARPMGKYPHYRKVGNFIFVSGTSSRRPDNTIVGADIDANGNAIRDVRAQTKAVIENIRDILVAANADLSDIVDMTSFLVDMKDFKDYNEVYGEFFSHDGPTRTTVAVKELPHPDLLIEMKAIAYKEPSR